VAGWNRRDDCGSSSSGYLNKKMLYFVLIVCVIMVFMGFDFDASI